MDTLSEAAHSFSSVGVGVPPSAAVGVVSTSGVLVVVPHKQVLLFGRIFSGLSDSFQPHKQVCALVQQAEVKR